LLAAAVGGHSAGDALTAGCFLDPEICKIEKNSKIQLVIDGRDAGTMQQQGAPAKVLAKAGAQAQLSRWKDVDVATDASAAGFNQLVLGLFRQ
jgi:cytidylate kinase